MEIAQLPAKISVMPTRENEFEPRLGKSPPDQAPKRSGVRSSVRQAKRRARSASPKPRQPSVRAHFAKGAGARAFRPSGALRRVVVKMRFAANGGGRAAPLRAHVKYLQRDGVHRERVIEPVVSQPEDPTRAVDYLTRKDRSRAAHGAFYDRASRSVDGKTVTAAWADDARHFRMIVSPEDGAALGDLKPFIRELMAGLEAKLGARLEWLAINHNDTDNPHSHVLIRGRRPDGQDLFIPSRLVSSLIREHAQEIVTRVLGPRVGMDLVKERLRLISEPGLTELDRDLLTETRTGALMPTHPDLMARLQRLEGWGLAKRSSMGWSLQPDLAGQLRTMADHATVARRVAEAQPDREPRLVLEADRAATVIGELVHLGSVDEISDRFLAVVETGSGELRYARFERPQDLAVLAGAEPGAVVAFEPNVPAVRPSDEAVARISASHGGLYAPDLHIAAEPHVDQRLVAANVRRLEVMRRMGFVERSSTGVFKVGNSHLATALAFEKRVASRAPFAARVVSYVSVAEQIDVLGPTLLDRVLSGEAAGPTGEGKIAYDFGKSLQQRRLFLIEQGWLSANDAGPSRETLARMAKLEVARHAETLSAELGVAVLTYDAHHVSGIYARRIDLAQGRMALVVGERQASLVPWRPALERFAGRHVYGVMRGQALSWSLSRGVGMQLPPM